MDKHQSFLKPVEFSVRKAIELQKELARRVRIEPVKRAIRSVGGADMAICEGGHMCVAAVVVMRFPELEVIEKSDVIFPLEVPYIPGLLSFREAPAVLAAWEKLNVKPDVLIIDGQGIAHPRRFGLACHIGVYLDRITVGCAKSLLVGLPRREPAQRKGSYSSLIYQGERVGTALRTREGVKSVYVSVGHRITQAEADRLVLRCCTKYRITEPIRAAHHAVTEKRGEHAHTSGNDH